MLFYFSKLNFKIHLMLRVKQATNHLFNKKYINYMEILNNNRDLKHILVLKNQNMNMDVC